MKNGLKDGLHLKLENYQLKVSFYKEGKRHGLSFYYDYLDYGASYLNYCLDSFQIHKNGIIVKNNPKSGYFKNWHIIEGL